MSDDSAGATAAAAPDRPQDAVAHDASGALKGRATGAVRAVVDARRGRPKIDATALTERLLEQLRSALADATTEAAQRAGAAKILRAALREGRDAIEQNFWSDRRSGLWTAEAISRLTDAVIAAATRFVLEVVHHRPNPTRSERMAVFAVGGSGRGAMAPFSDVDLLFLTPYKQTAWGEAVIESVLYLLWDLKLKVGHSVRSVDDCMRLAASDFTIRTALLEKRFLLGDEALAEELHRRLWDDLFSRTGPEFVDAKLAERDARHERKGGSRYLLEPNIKESKGGLRDLHTLMWIAKYLYRAETLDDLVEKNVFTEAEAQRFALAEAHLWTVRCAMHYVAGRPIEKLTFDMQVELAERLRYRSAAGQRPVERFMKRYFLAAKEVGDLTRYFCAALEEQHRKTPGFVGGLLRLFAGQPRVGGAPDWLEDRGGRLMVRDREIFARDPIAPLRFIDAVVEIGVLSHPETLRLIGRERTRVDEHVLEAPEARALFLKQLTSSKDPVRALRRLSETGVLGRLLPEFGRITGLMQFNMYHHYTVDEHTIQTVEAFRRILSGKLRAEHPIETEIAQGLPDHRVITLALLFHDIGKGLPEDHSIVGERIARAGCASLGLGDDETDWIAWLVRHHLLMSDVAQKRDISDPATVRDFARQVRSPDRLRLLYLLTACDIRAVGPGVWNAWKGQLLRQLYRETQATLTGESDAATRRDRVAAAQDALHGALPEWTDAEWVAYRDIFYPGYWVGLDCETQRRHAEMVRKRCENPLQMRIEQAPDRDATEVMFHTADHPGLFARMAGAFAIADASVVDARAYTTKTGMALNTFWVQDADGSPYDDPERVSRLRRQVERALKGEIVASEAIREKRRVRRREASFTVPPRVSIDNTASDAYTVVETSGRDRVGLLHDLARALSAANVSIFSAIIATYGEHAVDVFYVKDLFGMKVTQPSKQQKMRDALVAALSAETPNDGSSSR